jgi:hypothetical protein
MLGFSFDHFLRGILNGNIIRTINEVSRGTFSVSCIEITFSLRNPDDSIERA